MTVEQWLGKDNQLGIDIWNKKYRNGNETFDETINRISGGNKDVKRLLLEKKFLFGGRILSNRGLAKDGVKSTYSNCYVITPPEDNIESIFDCAKKLARTYSYGGGCGIDISKLAPRGSKVNNTAKETSGAISFMDLYSMTTGLIGQNGRRGALMISLDCSHPDIEEFIGLKSDLDRVTKANISIKLTDEFMQAVSNSAPYTLSFTREATGESIEKTVDARGLFMKIAEMNWDFAEPGALFWDRIQNWNLLSEYDEFEYAGVNPCAEEPLPQGGSCLLGSINLSEFVESPFTSDAYLDFQSLTETVKIAVTALNELLDEGLPLHPLQEQQDSVRDWRQIGLGVMGIADMLIMLGVRYGGEESIMVCDLVASTIMNTAMQQSSELAKLHGTFPKYNLENTLKSECFTSNADQKTKLSVEQYGLRNSQILTIAPTGTLSTMLGISGGIEPIFATHYTRKTESLHGEDVYYNVYTPIVNRIMNMLDINSVEGLPDYIVTAESIHYRDRIAMQAVWQSHIDASISSTVNVPEDFTVEDTFALYLEAWRRGLKGITIFRNNCKRIGILTTPQDKEVATTQPQGLQRGDIIDVSDDVIGKKRKLQTGCGSLHCSAFFDPVTGDLVETYLSKGSQGGCANFMVGLSRMISLAARAGIGIKAILDQLNSCGACPSYAVRHATKRDTSKGACCPMAVGNALLDMWNEMQEELNGEVNQEELGVEPAASTITKQTPRKFADSACPECGGLIVAEGGCSICKDCGFSKCG